MLQSKLNYLGSSIRKSLLNRKSICPNCKYHLEHSKPIDRKYIVTKLVACPMCSILVRLPTDDDQESNQFYQEEYTQGYTTDCPSEDILQQLIKTNFEGTERDYTRYIRFFEFLGIAKTSKVLDFGCSWGYGLFQFAKHGYRAEGFEVSRPRANYGREKMSLTISSKSEEIKGKFDVIFSAHVLEHLSDFSEINDLYKNNLADGGYFVAITPNGSHDFYVADYKAYHQLWGKVHPVLLTDKFGKKNFQD